MRVLFYVFILVTIGCAASKNQTQGTSDATRIHDIWVLQEINGRAITKDDYDREAPRLEVNTTENRAMGHTSCNSFTGAITLEGNALKFGPVAATRMYCKKSVESAFLTVLETTDRYRIEGTTLILLQGDQVLAKFKKVD